MNRTELLMQVIYIAISATLGVMYGRYERNHNIEEYRITSNKKCVIPKFCLGMGNKEIISDCVVQYVYCE